MSESEIYFKKPVRILAVRKGRDRIISTVAEAAEFIQDEWPTSHPYSRNFATWVFIRALRGECSADYARSVLVCAAQEAEIYLGTYEETPSAAAVALSHPEWVGPLELRF